MFDLPVDISTLFDEVLSKNNIPNTYYNFYRKWLRYYLDFCHKYDFSPSDGESLTHFIRKLQDKNQSPEQQKQAVQAVSIYYELLKTSIEAARPYALLDPLVRLLYCR
ncbi:MAG: phage integrase N-terminal SAM-like domain-containing protein [Nitrospirae bacterium]|nr:phage integrase N-terminal SAM-like domain-containing protein [Nitrospirota bacterium]